jgi:hypothetical protein
MNDKIKEYLDLERELVMSCEELTVWREQEVVDEDTVRRCIEARYDSIRELRLLVAELSGLDLPPPDPDVYWLPSGDDGGER